MALLEVDGVEAMDQWGKRRGWGGGVLTVHALILPTATEALARDSSKVTQWGAQLGETGSPSTPLLKPRGVTTEH